MSTGLTIQGIETQYMEEIRSVYVVIEDREYETVHVTHNVK